MSWKDQLLLIEEIGPIFEGWKILYSMVCSTPNRIFTWSHFKFCHENAVSIPQECGSSWKKWLMNILFECGK